MQIWNRKQIDVEITYHRKARSQKEIISHYILRSEIVKNQNTTKKFHYQLMSWQYEHT